MRKFVLLMVVLLGVLVLPLAQVGAIDGSGDPSSLAKYVPGDSVVFVALRTDDAYIDELQSVLDRVLGKLPAELGVPPVNLRDSLKSSLGTGAPVTYDDVRAALGDTVGISVSSLSGMGGLADGSTPAQPDSFVVAQVADRAAMDKLIAIVPGITEAGTEGDFTLYTVSASSSNAQDTTIALSDGWLLASTNADSVKTAINGGDTLDKNAQFTASMSPLPADSYNIVGYLDLAKVMESSMGAGATDSPMMGMSISDLGGVGFGATILDERALVIDVSQTAKTPALMSDVTYNPVNPDFLKNIPASSDFVVHGTDLGGYLKALTTLLDTASAASSTADAPKPSAQIAGVLQMASIELEADIFEGATGDYAIFGGIDVPAIMAAMGSNSPTFDTLPGGVGIAIQMKDAATAESVATKLGTFVTAMGGSAQGVKIGSATVNGVKVTNISAAAGPGLNVEIMLGAKDDILFLATSDVAQHITGGGEDVTTSAAYADAAKYILPNATQVVYTNEDGLLLSTVIPLALLGPSIGNIYQNIANDLQTSSLPESSSSRHTIQFEQNGQMQQMKMVYDLFTSIVGSASISSMRAGDVTVTRLVLSLE